MNTVRRSFAVFCLVLILSVLCTQTVLAADHIPPIQGGEEITQYVTSILQIKSIADANTFLGGFDMTLLLIIGAVGLVLAFFGYRLLKLAVALIGFAAGWTAASIGYDYAIGTGLISDASSLPEYLPTVVSLIGGAICALIAFKLLKFGIFVASAAGTFFVLSGISAFNALVDSIVPADMNVKYLLARLLGGIVVGLLALVFTKLILVLTTAGAGGLIGTVSFMVALGQTANPSLEAGIAIGVAVIGAIIQFRGKKKNK